MNILLSVKTTHGAVAEATEAYSEWLFCHVWKYMEYILPVL